MMKKNDLFDGTVSGYTAEGSGVVKADGYPVFVPQTAAGDEGCFRIVKAGKNFGFGIIEHLSKESDARRAPACPVYKKCGGCSLMHLTREEQLRMKTDKVKAAISRIGGFSEDLVAPCEGGEEFRYRNKAQYPVANMEKGAVFGFYAPRSHRTVEAPDCLLQDPVSSLAARIVTDVMNAHGIPAYDEGTHHGLVRHIYTRLGHQTKELQITLIVNGDALPQEDALVSALLETSFAPYTLVGVLLNQNTRPDNVILGKNTRVLYGREYIEDVLCGKRFRISPHSFYQVNPEMTEKMYQKALSLANLTGHERVFDLYCGIGTIGLSLAEYAKEVIGVEIVPEAVENAKENARLNGIENARFYCGKAEEVVPALYQDGITADVVMVDPPRKGCDETLIQTIGKMNPEKIVYISCDCATLARDMKRLAAYGYVPKDIQPFDQFPQTHHVETVCLLSRMK